MNETTTYILTDERDRDALLADADVLSCAQCGAMTPAAAIVIVERLVAEREVDCSDIHPGIRDCHVRTTEITGLCPTCAEHVPRPASD